MSLRAKLTGALVALSVVSVLIVGVWTAAGISRRLRAEVSDSLDAAAHDLVDRLNRPGGPGAPGGPGGPPPGLPDGAPGDQPRDFERILFQLVDSDGSVLRRGTEQELPVNTADRGLAAADAPGRSSRRDVELDGEPFELLTVSVGGRAGALQVARSLEESDRIVGATVAGTALALVVVAALAAVAASLLARPLTRPLTELTESAESVARTGRLDVELAPEPGGSTLDEARRLARAFRTMLASLAASRAAQQQLVQDAGHELRTPLTSLRTNVALLRRSDELSAATRQAALDDLDAETRELTELVNELVLLAGQRAPDDDPTTVDLVAVAEEVAARARRRSDREVVVVDDHAIAIIARRGAVARAVRNLVDNASKFDRTGGPIEVRVSGSTVEVADRGPGVATADLERIFDRFHRTDEARAESGSGLGLAIVAAVAADHQGSCRARPREGGGLVVSVTFAPEGPRPVAG